ncbi:MAG: porphobilinogen synthase [Candidatus Korarchaeota archaeon]|nr:porphobilinogen synthase [Candidatus Korarchaeota archaeon]
MLYPDFPISRPRRTRRFKVLRDLVSETSLLPSDLVYPLFVKDCLNERSPIPSLPGQYYYPVEMLPKAVEEAMDVGVRSFLIFGIPKSKDPTGSEAYSKEGVVQRALREVKPSFGDSALIITDVCMCHYTDHGHCGIVVDKRVDNDRTIQYLARIALSHAEAGADIVAPSSMMDGMVKAIREILDENGFQDVSIMSYSSKYASSFYGPFREAANSTPRFGDRRGYQMDPRNVREAVIEALLDVREGADVVMVKPALPYLDVIRAVKEALLVPVAAYSVSGEYVMLKLAAERGLLDEKKGALEVLYSMKRAGADILITYYATQVAEWLAEGYDPL